MELGQYDATVKGYIHSLRLAGGIVNRSIVVAAAKGMVCHVASNCLQEHSGHGKIMAQSYLGQIGCVRRKGTKAARKLPR